MDLQLTIFLINEFKVYPNPFKENLFIEFALEKHLIVDLFITDLLGKEVEYQELEAYPQVHT